MKAWIRRNQIIRSADFDFGFDVEMIKFEKTSDESFNLEKFDDIKTI